MTERVAAADRWGRRDSKRPPEEVHQETGLLLGESALLGAALDPHFGYSHEAVGKVVAARFDLIGADNIAEGGETDIFMELSEIPAQCPQTGEIGAPGGIPGSPATR